MRSLRTIASEWHDGQWSALYRFSSSGNYDSGTLVEIRREYNRTPRTERGKRSHRELRSLYYALLANLKSIRNEATVNKITSLGIADPFGFAPEPNDMPHWYY